MFSVGIVGIRPESLQIPTELNQVFWYFGLNKSILETTETKQADSQLSFATKIIKIELLVFENELIEDAMPAPKNPKVGKRDLLIHACICTSEQ